MLQKEEQTSREALESLGEIEKLLSSLANEDALRIFIEAEEGIESSTEAIKKLDLTQKRYYLSLKRLIEAGLIEKRESTYFQTILGKYCYKMGETLLNAVNQRDQLALADKLMKSKMFSAEEKEEVLGVISKREQFGSVSLADVIHEVKMITDYDQLVEEVITMLENAGSAAYVATNKFDSKVMEATFGVIDRGIKFYFLSSQETGFSESIQALKMVLIHPQEVNVLRKLLSIRELNVRVLKESLSHCFVVVDGEYGIIELPHPSLSDFYVAFKFRNISVCRKLLETFELLYEKASEDPRISFAKKYLSLRK